MRTLLLAVLLLLPLAARSQQSVTIDTETTPTPFPHFWEQMFGSGRTNLMLRDAYGKDLAAVHAITGLQYVRGHGVLDDENGVYTEDEHGNAVYNFAYIDQAYDALLRQHVRPVVELSFMPRKLASNPDALHPFWYKPNVDPPKSYERWDALITALARNLVDHFGLEEVSQWYFEVWNEPNIDFWGGVPRDLSYFELYDHTARALKAVSPRLRVGGPATAAADWVDTFLAHVAENHTPIDFVSSHGYSDDTIENLFPAHQNLPFPRPPLDTPKDERVCLAVRKVREQINAAGRRDLPLFWTEWNVQDASQAFDTIFEGPAVANTIRQCDGLANIMSFWTFSDVFEEGGPIPKPFIGAFGLRSSFGIQKPSFYAFALLHQLGNERLPNPSPNVIVTRQPDGTLVIAAWNIVDPVSTGQPAPPAADLPLELRFAHLAPHARATVQQVDQNHSNALKLYAAMGSPPYPTPAQVETLNREAALPPPAPLALQNAQINLSLTPNELILIRVSPR